MRTLTVSEVQVISGGEDTEASTHFLYVIGFAILVGIFISTFDLPL